MMVGDQVQVKGEKSEHKDRAGFIIGLKGRDEKETANVRLDETTTHEGGDEEFLLTDLRKL